VQLLDRLVAIPSVNWLRILYGYPEEVTDGLLDIMRDPKICSYFDLPFQHSHPEILRRMKRGMHGKRAFRLIDKIRKILPDAAIRTSLIVGFPGEGKNEFEHLLRFVSEARFDHVGVFTYSREEGTECFDLRDPVGADVKQRRRQKIMETQSEISLMINRKQIGQHVDVLIEGRLKPDPTLLVGRTSRQAPEVDGVVFIDHPPRDGQQSHTLQKVALTAADEYDLYGKLS
jgi:ribosomal protein S12 methylthiotransferase